MKRSSKPKPKRKPARKPAARKNMGLDRPEAAVIGKGPSSPASRPSVWLLGVGFILVANGVLTLPNFKILLPFQIPSSHPFLPYACMMAGFALLAWVFNRSAEAPALGEPSRFWAYSWFLLFFGVAFYTRFSHPETPQATFWFDDLVVLQDIRAIIDFGENHLMFIFGQREPGFPYLTAYLWKLLPNADGVFMVRLSSTLIDMGTCWGLYRVGRAVSGRWLGLILMALYSASKPLVIYAYFGYGANSCILSTVWMTYFFMHLIQKPSMRRFIYLGLALGFEALTYVPARAWSPFLIGMAWLWVLWTTREKPKTRPVWLLLVGGMFFTGFLMVYKNGFLPIPESWAAFFAKPAVYGPLAVVLLAAYFNAWTRRKTDETAATVFGWATTALLAILLHLPFYFQEAYSSHVVGCSALHVDGKMSLGIQVLEKLLDNFHFYFTLMFVQPIYDSGTYPIMYDSFFDPLPVIGMLVGLAFFLAKPSWRKAFVLSLVMVGMVPFILAAQPHAARTLAGAGPLLLLSGWGMEYLIRSFASAITSKGLRALAFLGLCLAWAWNGVKSDWSVWHGWYARVSHDLFIFEQADKDWRQYRVMVISNFGKFQTAALTALCDQREVYLWKDPTPLYLAPGEAGKDVEFLFWGNDPAQWQDRILKEFPHAQITTVPGYHEEDPNFMKMARVPFTDIENKKSGMVYPVRVPAGYWRRRFYSEEYGWARGSVWWDERVKDLNAPLPKDVTAYTTARADGEFEAKADGNYVFEGTQALDFIRLWVDGKKVIDYYPVDGRNNPPRVEVRLAQGTHQVSVATYFKNYSRFPQIEVHAPGGGTSVLGESN